jgi:hypothetical protein
MKNVGFVRVILIGVVYAVVGIAFGEIANLGSSDQLRFLWRLGAWVASGAVYAAHLWYEHFRLENSARATSLNAGLAVALGGFLLAVAALTHALTVPTHAPFRLYLLAIVVWPIITGVPAFVVTLVLTSILRLAIQANRKEHKRMSDTL